MHCINESENKCNRDITEQWKYTIIVILLFLIAAKQILSKGWNRRAAGKENRLSKASNITPPPLRNLFVCPNFKRKVTFLEASRVKCKSGMSVDGCSDKMFSNVGCPERLFWNVPAKNAEAVLQIHWEMFLARKVEDVEVEKDWIHRSSWKGISFSWGLLSKYSRKNWSFMCCCALFFLDVFDCSDDKRKEKNLWAQRL